VPSEAGTDRGGDAPGAAEKGDTHSITWLVIGLPVLFVGLFLVVWPVLDCLPFPGSTQQCFIEWWLVGVPLTWAGLALVRRGLPPSKQPHK